MENRILKRRQIAAQLQHVLNYPLTLVVAAMGYGKSNAVRDFLDDAEADFLWLSVESDETSASIFWDNLARHIAENEPAVA